VIHDFQEGSSTRSIAVTREEEEEDNNKNNDWLQIWIQL